ncbi:phosphoribosylaminoimidazole-succinocarboxamide synthase [Cordyceps militaris CM01]|uniref:Phosphoribosylaminoimidazole-succinocarboxamide synthase n=1 Tax=Cordyceps militaris (strain CM01) TaxID=983644 RepID=G3JTJ8_CORMM|nr:phosphoribosylaminoimidazole-succinocarboxamide synthase [Cordyceps militaris CM01]EGX88002.1 phosphoribosylaminoimidazole-succinocarboxamide synthase [Cordyceps militaris CM01]
MATTGITTVKLQSLPLVASGKVRELYSVDDASLLMAVTDRISAYDEILSNGFDILRQRVTELKHHVISMSPPAEIVTTVERALLRGRCMHIRSLKVFPIEAIRPWLHHGLSLERILQERNCPRNPSSERTSALPGIPIGEKDENISPEQARKLVGDK